VRPRRTGGAEGPPWLKWVTRISLAIGVVALVVTVWMVGPRALLAHLRDIGPWFGVLFAVELVVSLLDAGVIYSLTRGRGAPTGRQVVVAQLAGRAVNSVTPAATLGEALRVSLLARHCSPQRVLAAVLFAAIGALVFGLAFLAIGALATPLLFALPPALELVFFSVGAASLACAIAVVLLVRRGMVSELARVARRLHLISHARHDRWREKLASLDRRLRGDDQREHRRTAIALLFVSQVLQRVSIWLVLVAAGYSLSFAQVVGILSAGVMLGWLASIVPMGIGLAESGNGALFALLGAPTSLGVALALARRVNQIAFAVLGFSVLAADRVAHQVHASLLHPEEQAVPR
jgi:uncharacterized protein (TIRG00374 family)